MGQFEKEHAGSGIDKPVPKTVKEKIADGLKNGLDATKRSLGSSSNNAALSDKTKTAVQPGANRPFSRQGKPSATSGTET